MSKHEPLLPPRKCLLECDAWILATLQEAADWITDRNGPLEYSTLIRIAAAELEMFYRMDLIPDRTV